MRHLDDIGAGANEPRVLQHVTQRYIEDLLVECVSLIVHATDGLGFEHIA
jgi:hypothetical protein